MRNEFTISKRQVGGRTVYYYYAYDPEGNRKKFSTGQTTKAAALTYCLNLAKAGGLIPEAKSNEIFGNYFKDFWNWGKSAYLKKEQLRGHNIGKLTAYRRNSAVEINIMPYFGSLKLKDLTKNKIENWLLVLANKGFKPGSINQYRIFLNIMLDYAVEQGYLAANPGRLVKPFIDRPEERGILDPAEASELFNPKNINIYWKGNRLAYAANFLSAVSGMRLNEVRALRGVDIRQDKQGWFLNVEHSMSSFGLKDTKNHKSRPIPVTDEIKTMLVEIAPTPEGFIFSLDGQAPMPVYQIEEGGLYYALKAMGISEDERRRRNLCFHSWRHFYNTMLRAGNVSEAKIRAITGHADERMTDRYTHFTSGDLLEITGVQRAIIGGCYA
ncbi:MAG: tyrosine-type recombinase/integrase [Spirochaetia bacterium]|nr:tyrosine-type recombinase/integrase [Spirochaetia bacterium]